MMSPPAAIIIPISISISITIPISLSGVIVLRRSSAVRLYFHDFDKVVGVVVEFGDVQELGVVPVAVVVVVVMVAAVVAAVVVAVVVRVCFVVEVG